MNHYDKGLVLVIVMEHFTKRVREGYWATFHKIKRNKLNKT